jgi:hypothetical protein
MKLSTEVFQRAMPKQFRGKINQDVIDSINTTFKDPTLMEQYRDNLLSYTHVMKDGKFKMEQYIDAVRYVGFKLMGNTNIEAYTKTFPARYAYYLSNKTSPKDIASYVTSYNKNKLVNLIYEQTLVPTHILNADMYQKAINVQAELMMDDDVSPKVRSDAANSLLTHLKAPETKMEIDVTIKQDSTLSDLRATTEKLVQQQHALLTSGKVDAKFIAQSDLIAGTEIEDAEYV